MRALRLGMLGAALALALGMATTVQASESLHIQGSQFVRDGHRHRIISGSMHFQRIPRAYWRNRLRMARAMGLNTIETYVFWNAVEPTPGHFDFSGNNDVAAFVRMAQAEGLDVILRPGPYVCAEWDAGGLPAWLFADPSMRVRTLDPAFLAASDAYLQRLGREVAPLMASRGGPIVAVQVENEYGSYGNDRTYMDDIRQSLVRAGLGTDLLFTSDGPEMLDNDTLPGVLAVANFAPGEAKTALGKLAAYRPGQPRMAGEYWAGWFDAWGGEHAHTDAHQQADELGWMLTQGDSVNLYMFHGGTSFGFMNGANFQGAPSDHYAPQTTSYDYDAALDEAGHPTAKYQLFRAAIAKATGHAPPAVPAPPPMHGWPTITLGESASLWDNLPAPMRVDLPAPMESFGQGYGYILYRTKVHGPLHGTLYLGDVRDYAAVYVDRQRVGTVERRLKQETLPLALTPGEHVLDILVENTGRVNYGPHLADGRAGLVDPVWLGGQILHGWDVFPLPMASVDRLHGWTHGPVVGPAFHRGVLKVATPADSYMDVRAFAKGAAWINDHNLGRVWSIGPQRSLYLPAPWLHAGDNTVVVFDLDTPAQPQVQGLTQPVWTSIAQ